MTTRRPLKTIRIPLIAALALLLVLSSTQAAGAASDFDIDIDVPSPERWPGIDAPAPTLPPTPPTTVGELSCHQGILMGNFTDLDQDDDTLKVVAVINDGPRTEYPAVRAWGVWMVYMPERDIQMTMYATDDQGNTTRYEAIVMREDGSCLDRGPVLRKG